MKRTLKERPKAAPQELARLMLVQTRFSRSEQYIVSFPPQKGPQSCIIVRQGKKGRSFNDAIVVLPEKVPHKLMPFAVDLSVALGLARKAHDEQINQFQQDSGLMKSIPATHQKPPFQSKRRLMVRQLIEDAFDELRLIRPADQLSAKWVDRLGGTLAELRMKTTIETWTPWIISENVVRNRPKYWETWVVAMKWRELRSKSWEKIWEQLLPEEAKLYPRSHPMRQNRINSLIDRCSSAGLKKSADKQ